MDEGVSRPFCEDDGERIRNEDDVRLEGNAAHVHRGDVRHTATEDRHHGVQLKGIVSFAILSGFEFSQHYFALGSVLFPSVRHVGFPTEVGQPDLDVLVDVERKLREEPGGSCISQMSYPFDEV